MSFATRLEGLRQIWKFDNRWHLLLQRLLFRREALAVYRLGRLRLLVDHDAGDPSGAPEVLTHPMYADHLPHLVLSRPMRVLDLGANTGGFALFLAHHGVQLERIVAVELNPRTCIRLRYNLESNIRGKITVINAGVCGRSRDLEVRLGEGSVADSLYAPSFNSTGDVGLVPGLTIDDLWARYLDDRPIDVCKIDIEQAEYEVFGQPGHDMLRRCRVIVIEIHAVSGRHVDEIVRAIERLGFEAMAAGSDPSVHVFANTNLRSASTDGQARP